MFPSVFSTFNRPTASDRLDSPSHSALHNTVSSAVGQIEAVIGRSGDSSVLGTIIGDLRSPDSGGGGHVQVANKGGTGQTTYSKGDILVATSASVLSKLSAGTDGQSLIVNSSVAAGVQWGIPGSIPIVTQFSSVMTIWRKSSTLSYAVIEVQGPGGGGGLAAGGSGGGGGSGAYALGVFSAASLPLAASVITGTGGLAGSVGGISMFGSVISAASGLPGVGATGGNGGVASVGSLQFNGSKGKFGNAGTTLNISPFGADSYMGTGGSGNVPATRGGGGQGDGNPGADGLIIITEY